MTQATEFSHHAKAPERIPLWYWNRQVLLRLRRAVTRFLVEADVGTQSRVLELGCGNRPYERVVTGCNAQYFGADLPGNTHADFVIGPDGRVPEPAGRFDAVLSIQVLEHVPDPVAYLQEARRLLRPDGHLVLSTHGIWVYHRSPDDYWRWTSSGLRKLLQDQGFEILSFEGILGMLAAALQLIQDQLRRRLPRPLSRAFTALMQFLVSAADRLTGDASRNRDAMIYIVRAKPRAGS